MAKIQPLVAVFSAVDKLSAPVKKMQESIETFKKNLDKVDAKRFNTQLKLASKHFNDFKKEVTDTAKTVGVAFAGMAAAGAYGAVDAIASFDELGSSIDDASNKLGVNAEALQQWRWAAQRTGSSSEAMDKSLQKLNQVMQDASTGSNKKASELFKKLNIDITNADGSLRDATDVMGDLSKAFAINENGALRTAMAMTLLGKSGTELIPLLAGGTEEFQKYQKEMAEYGLTLSKEEIALAAETGDYFDRLGMSATVLKAKIGGALAPSFMKLSDAVAKSFGKVASNKEFLDKISQSVDKFSQQLLKIDWAGVVEGTINFIKAIVDLINKLGGLKNIVIGLGIFWGATKFVLPLVQAFIALSSALKILVGGLQLFKIALASTGIGALIVALGILTALVIENWDTIKEYLIVGWEKAKEAFSAFAESLAARWETIKASFSAAFEFIKEGWDVIVGLFQASIDVYATIFNSIKDVVLNVFSIIYEKIQNYINLIKDSIGSVIDSVKNIGSGISDFASSAWDNIAFWKDDEKAPTLEKTTINNMSPAANSFNGSLDVNIKTQKGTTADVYNRSSDALTLNTNQGILRG